MKKVKLLFSKFLSFLKRKKNKSEVTYFESVTKMPYIVNIENTTDKLIENVSLFFANNQIEKQFTKDGSYVANGLVISSGVPDVTYNHIVKNTITNKLNVGLTYIQSENTKQILEEFSIKIKSPNGTSAVKVLTPYIDPYQQQVKIVAL